MEHAGHASAASQRGYALVNGLRMYYEVHGAEAHGAGRPLVLLHGGMMSIEALGPLLPALAETRRVIAVELEGHGRTADLDRPLSARQMAEDVAGLIEQLGAAPADICGYSLGGITALRLAARRPDLVRKLVLISIVASNEGYYPATMAGWSHFSPQTFAGSPWVQAYAETAPHPEHWPVFIEKMKHLLMDFEGWPAADIQSITAPTLLILGDADLVRPEHALEMFRLLGGARPDGGMAGLPSAQMAILPGVTHFTILTRTDLLLPIIPPFLDAPMPGATAAEGDAVSEAASGAPDNPDERSAS